MSKKIIATLSVLLLASLGTNAFLYSGYKKVKTAQVAITTPVEVKLEEVTKTQPENLEYFLMNRLVLQSCDFNSDQALNYDDYFQTLVNQIQIIADSEFINKAQQKTMAVLIKNKFMETYGLKADETSCQTAYKFAEFKWKELNPVTTNENVIDISNKTEITTPIEPQINYGSGEKLDVPLPNSDKK